MLQSLYENGAFLRLCNKWVGQATVNAKALAAQEIPLPSLTMQEEIIAEIESYQRVIDGARQVVESYKPSIKINPSWEMKKLRDVCELQAGGTPARDNESFWNSNDYPWYTSGELNDVYTSGPMKYISNAGLEMSSARIFPKGSLLIGMYDTAAFKMSLLDRDATFNQAICGVKPNPEMDMMFLLLFFTANRDKYLRMRVGARQRNLTKQLISNLEVPVLPIDEQKEITASIQTEIEIVNQNERLIEIFQKKIKDRIGEVWGE